MSHPFAQHRQTAKEHSRVGHITKGYAKGGAVHEDAKQDRKLIKKMMKSELHADGDKSKHRMDRPKRAKGGRVKKGNAKTIVNVITGGHPAGGAIPPMPAPPMGVAPAGAMPAPAVVPHPMPMPPPGAGPGGPAPMPMRAKGGRVNQGSPVYEEGKRNGTQVQHRDGKDDQKDIGRRRVVTFMAGGRVKKSDGGDCGPQMPTRAKGGRVESPDGVAKATMLPGGGGGGEARLAKAHRAERRS